MEREREKRREIGQRERNRRMERITRVDGKNILDKPNQPNPFFTASSPTTLVTCLHHPNYLLPPCPPASHPLRWRRRRCRRRLWRQTPGEPCPACPPTRRGSSLGATARRRTGTDRLGQETGHAHQTGHEVQSQTNCILCPFLEHGGKSHEVMERREVEFKKTTEVLMKSVCTHARLRDNAMEDVINVGKLWL